MGFMFNIDGGYLEGLCRGFKCGILKQSDYLNLVQCETLEGLYTLERIDEKLVHLFVRKGSVWLFMWLIVVRKQHIDRSIGVNSMKMFIKI